MANEEWRIRFPLHKVINGEPRHSDHRPVIVEMEHRERVLGPPRTKTFRFEASWTVEEDCAAIVENAWHRTVDGRGGKVEDALQGVATDLGDWSRNILGDLEKRIKKARKSLEEYRRRGINSHNVAKEELLRAKVHWLQGGDLNTRFFH